MNTDDLFEKPIGKPAWPVASGREHPLIELRELVLLEVLAPAASREIRRVEFRPGLNIVWADPRVAESRNSGDRTSGHSAGKTTLCRILRWLLGETHFGNETLESRIATRFERGGAVLSLDLDGKPWVVGRTFFSKLDHHAVAGGEVADILRDGWPKEASIGPFFDELERLTVNRLAKPRLPGRKDNLSWTQLLAWLARDQEAALQSVEAWRSAAGGPQDRTPTKFERHVLLRLMADLLTPEEWDEMHAEKLNDAEKKSLNEDLPRQKSAAEEACKPLSYFLGGPGDVLSGDLTIAKAAAVLEESSERLAKLTESLERDESVLAHENHQQALRALVGTEGALARMNRQRKRRNQMLAELAAAILNATSALEMLTPPPGYCGRKWEDMEEKCRSYQDGIQTISSAAVALELERRKQEILAELEEEAAEIAEMESSLALLRSNEEATRIAADQTAAARDELLRLSERVAERSAALESVFRAASEQWRFCETQTARVKSLTDDNRVRRERQAAIRGSRFMDRLELVEHYRSVLSYLLGERVGGLITFTNDGELFLGAENRASLSSAAIEALKTISFDLAMMFRSVSGTGHHPRFHIHDSPKVADMSPAPYAAIFELALEVERQANGRPNFQYIITTTEPPPEHFQTSGHIILPLDASTKDGRLFCEDL